MRNVWCREKCLVSGEMFGVGRNVWCREKCLVSDLPKLRNFQYIARVRPGSSIAAALQSVHPSLTSSVRTLKLFRVLGPKVLLMAASAASRPRVRRLGSSLSIDLFFVLDNFAALESNAGDVASRGTSLNGFAGCRCGRCSSGQGLAGLRSMLLLCRERNVAFAD